MKQWLDSTLDWITGANVEAGHRRVGYIIVGMFALLLVTASFAVVSARYTFINADNTAAIDRNGRVAACRSEFNQRLLGEADDLRDAADGALDIARAELDQAETELLERAAFEDRTALTEIAGRFDELQANIDTAVGDVQNAIQAKDDARDKYLELIHLSSTDEAEFLERCNA
jgi:signal transduction histidine kinase